MVVVTKNNVTQEQLEALEEELRHYNLSVQVNYGQNQYVLGLIGDVSVIDVEQMMFKYPFVEQVIKISEPYKKANRRFKPEDTVIRVGDFEVGNPKKLAVIAGPCSVESEEQICEIARGVKACGATMLRGGAFKPGWSCCSMRTSRPACRLFLKL